jgi:alpha-glucosidase/alpha-D-xyloside xylohydrolase
MAPDISRREALRRLGAAGAGVALGGGIIRGQGAAITIAGRPVEIVVLPVSAVTARITVRPLADGIPSGVAETGALARDDYGTPAAQARTASALAHVEAGDLIVRWTDGPPTIHIVRRDGSAVQRLQFDAAEPVVSFLLPAGPLLGLGEGGPQFDRKGSTDRMRNGQGGYRLATHGTRAPIQWLVGTDGWALFIHQPYGAFDFTGAEGRFTPAADALPFDAFIVSSGEPSTIMAEYARVTGLPELPARWTLGYMQSHRTLGGPDEILGVARTFREKRLPCDALIYLGTEFAPSGWNTRNGEFTWHQTNFPSPAAQLDALHDLHFRVVVHVVVEGRQLEGSVADECTSPPLPSGRTADDRWPPRRQTACYWPVHRPLMEAGVDGWWPDQGDGFDGPSRFNRHRMYWQGSRLIRPDERPFALHRNASAGVQRFGGFIWSGDVQSRWETLATHVAVGINTALSGLPYWGTDIGGFVPTTEYTGELHVRWFQFGAFNPLFRAHGRNWHLRLPWGWHGGDGGPDETRNFAIDPMLLRDPRVEPICRKYLELRYRLMPYLYSVVREATITGLPIMRALWLHHAGDPLAVARGDEFLWGRDMLIAPVVEPGATSRRLYLPRGRWFDYWSDGVIEGGREIERDVDLETMPIYVRAGAVLPTGPVRQYTGEPVDEPTLLTVYPGANGAFDLYDDDGLSFAYREGAWLGVSLAWNDAERRLSLRLSPGSRIDAPRAFRVRLAGGGTSKLVAFDGTPLEVEFPSEGR